MKKLLILLLCPLLLFASCGLQNENEKEEPFSADFTIRPPESLTEIYYEIPLTTESSAETIRPTEEHLLTGEIVPDGADTLRYEDLRNLLQQAMFTNSPDASAVLWTQEICYAVDGAFREEDRAFLADLAGDLAQIASFPGMRETLTDTANVLVTFADVPDAELTYTKTAGGVCTNGQITIPSSLPAQQREKLMAEKMFRLFGFFYAADTPLESVLGTEAAYYPTQADLILLETVYAQMRPGMSKADCLRQFDDYFQNGNLSENP